MTVYRYVNGAPVTQEELRALHVRGTLFSGHVATARRRARTVAQSPQSSPKPQKKGGRAS